MVNTFLRTLRASCEERRIPLISEETETFLIKLLTQYQPKNCLEIGTAIGYSSVVIAKTIEAWGGKLCSCEVAYPAYLEAQRNLNQAQCWNTTLYPFDITKSESTITLLPQECDFVFIDAQKGQYGTYVEKIQRNLKKENNRILLDDVIKYQMKLEGLYEFLQKNQIDYEIFPTEQGDGVMLITNL